MKAKFKQPFPERQIRAHFTEEFIRVYQAYNEPIALSAVENQNFSLAPKYNNKRMTWIKPSWCWMAYRCGYSYKGYHQSHVLAIDLDRKMFDEVILKSAVLASQQSINTEAESKRNEKENATLSDVIIQWDPERDVALNKLEYRSIQIGIRGNVARRFIEGELIRKITDVTEQFQNAFGFINNGKIEEANKLLPLEIEYPVVDDEIQKKLLIS
ncbi:hypothetical protein BB559_002817 [Furculomyces boomerangus]|uniref:DUF4291 domain-containing protein n=2 Tax=Harpellales TaxID=61421 RepID=A0A2T9YS64_9FUNG|nr:hypothetical protein BB559_002817 [Furculomyces boomerangus]PVZ96871.1 hypothetical protein BB558_007203 [Smittium angustum]